MKRLVPYRGASKGYYNITLELDGNILPSICYTILCRICNTTIPGFCASTQSISCPLAQIEYYNRVEILTIRFLSIKSQSVPWHRVRFYLRYREVSTKSLNANMIADEIFISLTRLMNHNQISVSRYETDHIRITYEVTFSKLHTDGDIIEVVVMDKMNEYGIEDHVFPESHLACSVHVSLNGVDFLGGYDNAFIFDDRFVVSTVVPSHGSLRGGTAVSIKGDGFMIPQMSQDIFCKFGGIRVRATIISTYEIRCLTPPFPGRATVHVGIELGNEKDFFDPKVLFQFVFDVYIYFSFPRTLPVKASYAGEALLLTTDYIMNADDIKCLLRVDIPGTHFLESFKTESKGTPINSTVVKCDNDFSWNRLFISSFLQDVLTIEALTSLEYSKATLRIQIATNGEDWSNAIQIPFIGQERIQSIHPRTGRATGGTQINVLGQSFVNTGTLACRFGAERIVPAVFISSTHLQCITPPITAYDSGSIQNMSVTNNERAFQ